MGKVRRLTISQDRWDEIFETGNYEGDQGLIDFDFLESRHLRIGQTPTLIEHLGPVYYDMLCALCPADAWPSPWTSAASGSSITPARRDRPKVPSKFDGEGE